MDHPHLSLICSSKSQLSTHWQPPISVAFLGHRRGIAIYSTTTDFFSRPVLRIGIWRVMQQWKMKPQPLCHCHFTSLSVTAWGSMGYHSVSEDRTFIEAGTVGTALQRRQLFRSVLKNWLTSVYWVAMWRLGIETIKEEKKCKKEKKKLLVS